MRATFFTLLFTLLFCLNGQSQNCLPNGITFTTQAEIDNFSVNYPGCTVIEGDMSITAPNGTNITNLNGLSGLTAIGGGIIIYYNPVLTSLSGLANVATVGEYLIIQYNPALTSLSGPGNITSVGGYLRIRQNDALTNLNGFDDLTTVGGLEISYNPALTSLSGLQNITTVGEDMEISGNPALTSLSGLENLTSIGGYLYIFNCEVLTSLSALGNITSVGGGLDISQLPQLTSLSGLQNITAVGGGLGISNVPQLTSLSGLENISFAGGDLIISDNPMLASLSSMGNITSVGNLNISNNDALTDLSGLENITTVGGGLLISQLPQVTSLSGLENITLVGGDLLISQLPQVTSLSGLANVTTVGGGLGISNVPQLTSLSSLGNITSLGSLNISSNDALTDLSGLENITTVGYCSIFNNAALTSLNGLGNVTSVGYCSIFSNAALTSLNGLGNVATASILDISSNPSLTSLTGLGSLITVTDSFTIHGNALLNSLNALNSLTTVGRLAIYGNAALTSLNGLDNLVAITQDFWGFFNSLTIANNTSLTSINSLQSLTTVSGIQITDNTSLPDCAVFAVCNYLLNEPDFVIIANNAPGCNTPAEVAAQCNSIPVLAEVRLDHNNNCQADATDTRAENVQVRLAGMAQTNLRATEANGQVHFGYLENGAFSLHLPQFPAGHWAVCQEPILLDPDDFPDTVKAIFLLSPLTQCPELTVDLGLPSFFRGCLVNSEVEVAVTNTGTVLAQGVRTAVVMPQTLLVLTSTPPLAAQSGDTLFFEMGDLPPFAAATVQMSVKTDCDVFLIGQTLCLETFASLENPCPNTQPPHSEIKLSAQCIADDMVHFTIKNIGDAPTQGWHAYKIIRNQEVQYDNGFNLDAQQSLEFDFPADGATWRMEATKFDDGTPTAVALENCGGLTTGLITAFWLDEGPLEYDFDCRQVIGSYDPNLKSAVPTGTGWQHIISANRPLQYTIDFQNTGTDTAFRVLLRDVLPQQLDVNTFRPGFSSHPCTWEIRGLNTLEVLFSPIALPDSNVNEPSSHGFFSFTIDQKPNLPDGTYFYNTASIIFDFNPPIVTNYVQHTIGKLTVQVDETQQYENLWQVWGNPVHDAAIFRTEKFIVGEKRFELYDAAGRLVRRVQFSGQEFEFQRDFLPGGLYFFSIRDAQGRVFTGKIVAVD